MQFDNPVTSRIPMPENPLDSGNKSINDQIVILVQRIIKLKLDLKNTEPDRLKNTLEMQIEKTDKEIDKLVYDLYELTDEEIKIVEGLA